jgi:putative N6-adenine-specific DNA methylase
VCAPGLEPLLRDELIGLGLRRSRPITGGVTFDATTRQLYAVNVWSRIATRVLVRAARFRARTFEALERELAAVDWQPWLPDDTGVRVRVTSTRSRLYHTGAIEERVHRALGAAPANDEHAPLVVVRIVDDEAQISIDASGAALYKRGWRTSAAKAPLRETLAAAMVLASGWTRDAPLIDPFCGSGTIAIEAALLAAGHAPGAHRAFAFERWPSFEPGTMASVRASTKIEPRSVATIVARDRDDGAVETTIANATRAGVADAIDVQRASISELVDLASLTSRDSGWVLSNPPFGRRVSGGGDLRDLFARFGDVARAALPGWHVGLLVADARAAGHTRLGLREVFATRAGGIPVQFVVGPVPGSP